MRLFGQIVLTVLLFALATVSLAGWTLIGVAYGYAASIYVAGGGVLKVIYLFLLNVIWDDR